MRKIGIVILNYKNYLETIKCIDSLLRQQNVILQIVVVDNGSGNRSYEILNERYSNNKLIAFIKSETNLGYSSGNNLGISYLQKQNFEFILVANSDIILSTNDILKQLIDGYEPKIGLIVPIIKNPNGSIDQRVAYKKKYLYLRIIKKMACVFCGKNFSDKPAYADGSIEQTKTLSGTQYDRYVVSGSAFILTRDFFNWYDGLYPETFLYYEEWATILLLHKANLFTKIVKCDPIIHKGAASTPDNIKNITKQRKKIMNDSAVKVLKLLFMPAWLAGKKY